MRPASTDFSDPPGHRPHLREDTEVEARSEALERLQADLAERELQLATLRAELRGFELLYVRTLGLRYAELDGLEAEIAEFLATAAPGDVEAGARAARARAHAAESEKAADWDFPPEVDTPRFAPSDDTKKLYRRVAKCVHPDLADDERDRGQREEWMAEANQAYAEGNTARLLEILQEWQRSGKPDDGETEDDWERERLDRQLAQAAARLSAIGLELEGLRNSELYRLYCRVEECKQQGTDLLASLSAEIDRRIASARQRLRVLKSGRGKTPPGDSARAASEKGGADPRKGGARLRTAPKPG